MSDKMSVRSLEEAWLAVVDEVSHLPMTGPAGAGWPAKKAIFFAGAGIGAYLEKLGVNVAAQYQEYADGIINSHNDH